MPNSLQIDPRKYGFCRSWRELIGTGCAGNIRPRTQDRGCGLEGSSPGPANRKGTIAIPNDRTELGPARAGGHKYDVIEITTIHGESHRVRASEANRLFHIVRVGKRDQLVVTPTTSARPIESA